MAVVDSMAFADSSATRGRPELRLYRQAESLRSLFRSVGSGWLPLAVAAGETVKPVLDGTHDEGEETLTLDVVLARGR